MKKNTRPAPKTGIITRSGGKTSFRKLDPTEGTTAARPKASAPPRSSARSSSKNAPSSRTKPRSFSKDDESSFSEKKFGDKKFSDKKFSDKKFGDKKFSDEKELPRRAASSPSGGWTLEATAGRRRSRPTGTTPDESREKKFEDKKFGKKKFSDKPFATEKKSDKYTEKPAKLGIGGKTKAARTNPDAVLRLNKFIADAGLCSRRQADEYIEKGVVKVNGKVVTEHGTKVHLSDLVTVNGEPVNAEKHLTYIVLNKPKDYITTTSDEKGRKTVMELIPLKQRIYPIGRLDRHTTGVLLLTNDGDLAHRLMHPSYEVSRIYRAYLDKRLTQNDMRSIAKGVQVESEDGESYISGECNVAIDPEDPRAVTLELAEGKNREVRRIFAALGYEVEKLDRKGYAGISSRGLGRGEYRHLTSQEIRALEQLVKLDRRLENATTAAKPRTKQRRA
jgi:23S rRNA pseudouridine2605 synthase